jgi:RNA polymerase sigma-70 factor (ECF subfamily)
MSQATMMEIDAAPRVPGQDRPAKGGASLRLSGEAKKRFRALVDANFDFIWRALRGLGVPNGGADDAAQQVFVIALQKLDEIAIGSERSFLFGTALGVAANARRKTARSKETADDDAVYAQADTQSNPEEMASRNQARARLDAILAAMPLDLRTVFVLFELEALTMAEIAEMLALPPGTVASRLRRAREDFHARVARQQASMSVGGAR